MRRRSLLGSVPAFALLSDGSHIMGGGSGIFNIGAVGVIPGTPTLSVGSPTSGSLSISITSGTGGAPSSYTVQRSLDGSTGWAAISGSPFTYSSSPQTIVNSGLSASTAYYYRGSVTNSSGTSGWSTVVSATTSSSGGYADGSAGAPVAAIPQPNILSGYVSRPPWNVAGVDYGVGVPTGTVLTPWSSWTQTGVSTSSYLGLPFVEISGLNNATIEGIDFSTSNGAWLAVVGCNNLTIKNCKFGGTNYASSNFLNAVIVQDSNSSGITIKSCSFDGGVTACCLTTTMQTCFLFAAGNGGSTNHITLQYNWFYHAPDQILEIVNCSATVDYRFNLIDTALTAFDNHYNCQEWSISSNGFVGTSNVSFNCFYQPAVGTSQAGEFIQFYYNTSGGVTGIMDSCTCSNNVMIALANSGMSCFIDALSSGPGAGTTVTGTNVADQNYFDITGIFTGYAWYPGAFTAWTRTGNINMVTGGSLNS